MSANRKLFHTGQSGIMLSVSSAQAPNASPEWKLQAWRKKKSDYEKLSYG
jgi:hypothetical protein